MENFVSAYQLAHFLHRDEPVAFEVALAAVSHLGTERMRQEKRYHYQPKFRRYKLMTPAGPLLQHLVFRESETFEQRRERSGAVTRDDLLIWFLKHLVFLTGQRATFFAVLGMTRILYRYDMQEAMAIYDRVSCDPACHYQEGAFRAGKKTLFDALSRRFAPWVEIRHGAHGERLFTSQPPTERERGLVAACLEIFTPAGTCCQEELPAASAHPDSSGGRQAELQRLHALGHPPCFERLTRSLGLPPPAERLSIPVFRTPTD